MSSPPNPVMRSSSRSKLTQWSCTVRYVTVALFTPKQEAFNVSSGSAGGSKMAGILPTQQLSQACLVLDVIDPKVKRELLKWWVHSFLLLLPFPSLLFPFFIIPFPCLWTKLPLYHFPPIDFGVQVCEYGLLPSPPPPLLPSPGSWGCNCQSTVCCSRRIRMWLGWTRSTGDLPG